MASVIILTQLLLQNVQHRADELATPDLGELVHLPNIWPCLPLFLQSCEALLSSGVPHRDSQHVQFGFTRCPLHNVCNVQLS